MINSSTPSDDQCVSALERGASPYIDPVPTLSMHLRVRWFERALLFVMLAFFCFHSMPRAWKTLNTDFPNYYLAASLARDGFDTSRMYEWTWIERQKDFRDIDIRVLGLLPITPPSTLVMWPLTFLKPLVAKHAWILCNLAFLVAISWLLRSLTSLSYTRIALFLVFSFPLYRNLLYGQFYIFILLLVLASCLSYLRGYSALAGSLLALAAVFKIFPVLLFVFFLRRRDWRALAAGLITGCVSIAISIEVFGLRSHLVWLREIIPWVMRGEGLGTYANVASITCVLHCLFLAEPQWNPHPWHESIVVYSVLVTVLPMIFVAPAILLIRRADVRRERVLLEWSALVTVALTVSTIPASYNFVLMAFPACVIASLLIHEKRYISLGCLIVVYLGIGYPLQVPEHPLGIALLLYVPRLFLMLVLLCWIYARLFYDKSKDKFVKDWTRYALAAAMLASVIVGIPSTIALEHRVYSEYTYRLPVSGQGYLNATPQIGGDNIFFTSFMRDGYRTMKTVSNVAVGMPLVDPQADVLSFAARGDQLVEEVALHGRSELTAQTGRLGEFVGNAEAPSISLNGQDLAYVRSDRGRGQLILRKHFLANQTEQVLTSRELDVYEASFLSSSDYAFSAMLRGEGPFVELVSEGTINQKRIADARYPSISPDGHWLAYSHLDHGYWNLWLLDMRTEATKRIAEVPCNQIQPSWRGDSKSLIYSTDCGRSIWFTALAERRVVP